MAVDVGSAVGYLDLDINGFLTSLRSAQNEADKTSKNIVTKFDANMQSAGKNLTSAGSTLTKSVTVPIVGLGTAAIKTSSDFESAMSKVSAISGASGADLNKLNKKAQEMGAKTKFSATESANAFEYMAMAGWKTEDMLDGIEGIMNLAAADGLDLATTSDIVTDALTAFGLSAKDSGHFADVLAKTSSSANTNVSMLGESFKYVAPVAGALGYSAEDAAITLGLMANAGIKGSQAGTALRSSISRLVKPTDDAAAMMDKYGISLTNTDGTMKPLGEVMNTLREKLGGLSEAEQAQAAATLFGQEAMSGMLAIINASDSDYQSLTDSIYNADGAAQQMSDTMLNNLSGQLTLLKSALEGLAIQFGEILMPYIKQFVGWLQSLVQKLQEMTPEQKEQIVKWAAFAAAIGPALVVIGKLTSGVGTLVSAFSNLSGGFKAVSAGGKAGAGVLSKIGGALASIGPWGWLIIAIIVALSAAFATLWKTNEEFKNKIIGIWNQVKEMFVNFGKQITEQINSLGFNFENFAEVLKALWKGLCDFLAPLFIGAFQGLADTIKFTLDTTLAIVKFFVAILKGDWEGAWSAIKEFFVANLTFIVDFFKNIGNMLIGILDAICGWFGTTWEDTWNSIKTFFINIWTSITTFFTNAWNTIKNVVQVGIMFIVELFKAAFNLITLPFRFIWENCKETITSIWNTIKTTISNVLNAIKTTITNVWNSIKSVITNVVNAIKTVISNVFNAIKTVVTNIWNGIKSAIEGPINSAKTTISSVVDSIKSKFSSGFNSVKSTVTDVFDSIKTKISNVLDSAKNTVKNSIDKIKGFFNFSWSLPKLKMPHFSIKGEFSLNPPSVPKLSIDWYKKAMGNGMILDTATIFGFNPKTGKFLGGGEAGSETVVGTKNLMSMIKKAVAEAVGPLVIASREFLSMAVDLGYVTYNGFTKLKEVREKQDGNSQSGNGDGDTFVFYSPKAIDEIEAAKQIKKTKRELAEGF